MSAAARAPVSWPHCACVPPVAAETKTEEQHLSCSSTAAFTVISWNIEGLANDKCRDTEDEIILRTQVAMRELLAQAPTLICLQEVIPQTVATIERMLFGRYLDVEGAGGANGGYFTKMFVQRASGLKVHAVSRERFNAGSLQGRDLLLVTLEHKGTRVCVATSHLGTYSIKKVSSIVALHSKYTSTQTFENFSESLKDNMKLRQQQLREGLQRIEAQSKQGADLCLLVGDLNMSKGDETLLTETTRGIYT
jgi:endonuclease/exonuclease/phosphatase family metal-dependent hydrolase